ncbi:hypothetical protein [Nannocystis sp. SCPEA4]|uniref:hypothetical protein n=1 Tax=Nannocystis sp. SCPEA4 TaxID=2996787 RepID=UPI002271AB44|nr:hypothetical protein [Nannocystis sp. SCPEA4]MCY1055312.1 hypothetical protein [Nannocystis sp. SCPEA4]
MFVRPLAAALALAACNDNAELPGWTCPLDQPLQIAGPSAGWTPTLGRRARLERLGDHVLYTFPLGDQPGSEYWLVDRCGGAPERFLPAAGMLYTLGQITADHVIVYGLDTNERLLVLDRLDVPGFDGPRPVLGLPDEKLQPWPSASEGPMYIGDRRTSETRVGGAAAIGGTLSTLYVHHGDPAVPAVGLGDQIVGHFVVDDRVLVHDDDGDLRDVDPRTGEFELVLTGVRRFEVVPGGRRLLWQQLGDDRVEPIFLHDRDSGEDIQVAVNDFTALSWNRPDDPLTQLTGTWAILPNSPHAALYGPAHAIAAVIRLDTGASVTPPAGARLRGAFADQFTLELADDDELVLARWDPHTDALREWFRGPLSSYPPAIFGATDDAVTYSVPDGGRTATLWHVDLVTGESAIQVPRVGLQTTLLPDGRYFTVLPARDYNYDILVFDPDTGLYTIIASDVDDLDIDPEHGILHSGADGLWFSPFPPP